MFVGITKGLGGNLQVCSRAAAELRRSVIAALAARRRPIGAVSVSFCLMALLVWTAPLPQGPGPQGSAKNSFAKPVAAAKLPFSVAAVAATARPAVANAKARGVNVVTVSAQKLFTDFRRLGYRLEDLRKGAGAVPRVFVRTMPKDIGRVRSIARRKAVFLKTMLPLILHINEELRETRARVKKLAARMAKGRPLAAGERAWLEAQFDRFNVKQGDFTVLLRRIDVIPPSLAMAQGAEESGWGSSRFALEGRALFGQRTFKTAPGIVPLNRADGARFKIRRFDHLLDGVRSYVHNLNSHPAYAGFRALRARLRAAAGGPHGIDSLRLVEALENYSERGANYIRTIKSIIRFNDLKALDDDRLSQVETGTGAPGPA